MPSIEVSQKTLDSLKELANQNISMQPPASAQCSHWTVTNQESEQIACSCDMDSLAPYLGLLNEVISATGTTNTPNKTASSSPESSTVPTPATVRFSPLEYTPPSYKGRPGDNGFSIIPAAQKAMDNFGITSEDIAALLENPTEILPAAHWRTIYRGNGFDVIYSEQIATVLSVKRTQDIQDSGTPRLSGQKQQNLSPVPSNVDDMRALLESFGFEVEHGGKHWKIQHAQHPGIFASMPYTPSDFRWAHNLVSELRAKFGIDVRGA